MKAKRISHYAMVGLLLLSLAGSTGFGPRAYMHPRRPTTTVQPSATPVVATNPATAPAKPAEEPSFTHTLVEWTARGVQAAGEALAETVTGLAKAVADAVVSQFVNRAMR